MPKARKSLGYFLTFGGTRARKHAPTLAQARADARYWLGYGQTKVCIHKKLPHGSKQVQCVTKRRKRASLGCGCGG